MAASLKQLHDSYITKYHDLSHAQRIIDHNHFHNVLKSLVIAAFVILISLFALIIPRHLAYSPPHIAAIAQAEPKTRIILPTGVATLEKAPAKEVIGFLPSWMVAKAVPVRLDKLTEVIYFALAATAQGELVKYNDNHEEVLEWSYFKSDYFQKLLTDAKQTNTKVLISIKIFDNGTIDQLITNPVATDRFIANISSLTTEYKLDGVNLDFEYFTDIDYPTSLYLNRFLEKLSTTLKAKQPKTIISFDVNAGVVLIDTAYDMVKIGSTVDQVILMAYDYYRAESQIAGPVAPLYSQGDKLSIDKSVASLSGRVAADKIILGLPLYGYEWQTTSENHSSSVVENSGALATYKRVDDLIHSRDDIKLYWDEIAQSPWLVYSQSGATKQIYYEDPQSLGKKIEYMSSHGLGGIALWAIGYEGNQDEIWDKLALQKQTP